MNEICMQVQLPTLLVHSRDVHSVLFNCTQAVYDQPGCRKNEILADDGMDHSLVMDPKWQVVFAAGQQFLARVVATDQDILQE
jgi:hypothetical protein